MDSQSRRLQMRVMMLEEDKAALVQHIKQLNEAYQLETSDPPIGFCGNVHEAGGFVCSECGAAVTTKDIHVETGVESFSYCPNCGRIVVSE